MGVRERASSFLDPRVGAHASIVARIVGAEIQGVYPCSPSSVERAYSQLAQPCVFVAPACAPSPAPGFVASSWVRPTRSTRYGSPSHRTVGGDPQGRVEVLVTKAPEPARSPGADWSLGAESDEWRSLLIDGHRSLRVLHRVFRHVPAPPRCKMCYNPFGGVGGRIAGALGFRPSPMNPNFCKKCCADLPSGGATVDVSILFIDMRGSTTLGEGAEPRDFAQLLGSFYQIATETLIAHDAIIDKLIGDEVMALFFPGIAGSDYRKKSVRAAVELARGMHRAGVDAGVGVHAGDAYVGQLGSSDIVDFTALGDTVNTAARLQAHAGSGQVVISAGLRDHLPPEEAEITSTSLAVKGRNRPVEVAVVSVR